MGREGISHIIESFAMEFLIDFFLEFAYIFFPVPIKPCVSQQYIPAIEYVKDT